MPLAVMAMVLWCLNTAFVIAAVPEQVIEARVTAINESQGYVELDGERYSLDFLVRGAQAGESDSVESLEILRAELMGQTVFVAVTNIATPTEPAHVVRVRRSRW